jgi:hypothetical protein
LWLQIERASARFARYQINNERAATALPMATPARTSLG